MCLIILQLVQVIIMFWLLESIFCLPEKSEHWKVNENAYTQISAIIMYLHNEIRHNIYSYTLSLEV